VIHTTDDGVRIHYEVQGDGEPALVLVHGWCSNLRHWDAQVAHFAPRHRVLAVDRRGHGESDVPAVASGGYTASRHGADLAEVMDATGTTGAVVVGHAGGAPGVLALAADRPDLVRGLVLVDTIVSPQSTLGDPDDPAGAALGAMVDRIVGADGEDGAAAFATMYAAMFSPHAGPVATEAVTSASRVPAAVAAEELRSLAIDTVALARAGRAPVLWLTVAGADEARLRTVFADVQFGQVVGSGHFPHLEVPDQVNAMLDRFVSTLP